MAENVARLLPVIEQVFVETLAPYARNSRTHTDKQINQIAASVREFGWTNPVLIDASDGIIAGHARVLAAQRLGMVSVPCIRICHLTESQRRALVIVDNKMAENGGWDNAILAEELRALGSLGFDVSLTGFSDTEIQSLFCSEPDEDGRDPDACPGIDSSRSVSEIGDCWTMGVHRLICGDCTQTSVLTQLMAGSRANIVWTDPPYNVNYKGKSNTSKIIGDNMSDASFRLFLGSFYRSVWNMMEDGAVIYVAHAETERANFTGEFIAAGFKLAGVVIWRKNSMVLGRSDYQWAHEPILYGWKPGAAHCWYGGRKKTTVTQIGDQTPFVLRSDLRWELHVENKVFIVDGTAEVQEVVPSVVSHDKPVRSGMHPTMKPVGLIERQLRNHVRPNDIVLDPFGGSGSTLIAADRLGVAARLCEISPEFCDVIVRRWQEYCGGAAILEKNGRMFSQIERAL